MVRKRSSRNYKGHDDSDNPLYHSLKRVADLNNQTPEDDFDKIFIVPDEEHFFVDDHELVVENATHAIKGDVEYVLINNTWYPINPAILKPYEDHGDFQTPAHEENNPDPQESGLSLLTICVIFLLIGGVFGIFILPFIADAAEGNDQDTISPEPVITEGILPQFVQTTESHQNPVPAIQATPTQIQYFTRSYHWTYGGRSPTYVLKIPESLYQYYRNQPHNRNYVKYAISEKDRYILSDLVSDFRENTDSKTEAAHQVVAFVQSIPYSKDFISTGYNEYPRYPIETLVDGRGDCEDTAILTAALLKEMSYDVVLLSPPGHMAIGITCPACKGTSITIDSKKYYYLETTGEGWEVGQLPPEYRNDQVRYYRI